MVFGAARQLLQQKKLLKSKRKLNNIVQKSVQTPCGDERLCSPCLWKHGLRR
jgi:hypothetical protein